MKIIFADINPKITAQLMTYFADESNVEVHTGDIFAHKADAIVSPANSFGYMDGGIDMVYCRHFGFSLESRVQRAIQERFDGELLVGQATIVPTGKEDIPWLISAPTMRVPMHISGTVNAYLAFRAALRAAVQHNDTIALQGAASGVRVDRTIDSILCPGLGTFVGNLEPNVAAVQMLHAYNEIMKGHKFDAPGIRAAHHAHYLIAKGVI